VHEPEDVGGALDSLAAEPSYAAGSARGSYRRVHRWSGWQAGAVASVVDNVVAAVVVLASLAIHTPNQPTFNTIRYYSRSASLTHSASLPLLSVGTPHFEHRYELAEPSACAQQPVTLQSQQ
jgi:hypothetical protein